MGKRKRRRNVTGITAQNKDVVSKWFGETMRNRSLSVYGIDVPRIVDVRPANLPAVETNEQRMDNLFLLEDGSYALLDYESNYRIGNKVKYAGYVARLLRRLQKEGEDIAKLRVHIIVIYTADVVKKQTDDTLDMGGIVIRTTEGFLSEISSEEVKMRIRHKIEQKEPLEDRDLMELVILPLTYRGKEAQQKAVYEAVDLAKGIENESVQVKAMAGILSFSDKIIDDKLADKVRGCLDMTKVGAIIAREMEEREERGRADGEARGRTYGTASSLLTVLSAKGEVPAELEKKIQSQTRSELLEQWLKIAAVAPDVGAFEEQIMCENG